MGLLQGVRVLDLSRVLAGPWASQLLADLGAEVIKIERPGAGDDTRTWGAPWWDEAAGLSAYFLSANRGKRSVAVDIAQAEGAALVRDLAARSQILIENFKVGALQRYGLDWETLRAVNPALVYCSITGYGQSGPNAQRAGYDAAIQAEAGLMSLTGEPASQGGAPQKVGVAVVDLMTGMYALAGVLAALRHAERIGEGQHIDLALFDTQVAALANQASNYLGQRIFDAYWHSGSLNESCSSVYDPNCLPTLTYADTLYQFAYAPNGNLLFENTRPYTNVGSANWWYGSQTHFSDDIWLGGEPVAVWRDGSMYAISNDHLGRPEVVTNTAGAVVWRARNLAYHREQTVNNSNFGSLGLSFPGQYLDAESGMAYNWHRVYDPSSGRYTQSDPIGLAGGLNAFAYVGGNPVNGIDPHGLEGWGSWTYAPGQSHGANPCQQRAMQQMLVDIAINISPASVLEMVANIGFDRSINPMSWGDTDKREAAIIGATVSGVAQAQGFWDSTRVSPDHARLQDLVNRPNSSLGARNAASTARKLSNSSAAMRSASRMRAIGGPGIGALGAFIGGMQAVDDCTCKN